eukprot:755939-Hanusia_phi.AAC.1
MVGTRIATTTSRMNYCSANQTQQPANTTEEANSSSIIPTTAATTSTTMWSSTTTHPILITAKFHLHGAKIACKLIEFILVIAPFPIPPLSLPPSRYFDLSSDLGAPPSALPQFQRVRPDASLLRLSHALLQDNISNLVSVSASCQDHHMPRCESGRRACLDLTRRTPAAATFKSTDLM